MEPPNIFERFPYVINSRLVESAILSLQPRNGTDYSTPQHRRDREMIAVNVHNNRPPFEGIR